VLQGGPSQLADELVADTLVVYALHVVELFGGQEAALMSRRPFFLNGLLLRGFIEVSHAHKRRIHHRTRRRSHRGVREGLSGGGQPISTLHMKLSVAVPVAGLTTAFLEALVTSLGLAEHRFEAERGIYFLNGLRVVELEVNSFKL